MTDKAGAKRGSEYRNSNQRSSQQARTDTQQSEYYENDRDENGDYDERKGSRLNGSKSNNSIHPIVFDQPTSGASSKMEICVEHVWKFENEWRMNLCRCTNKCSRCWCAFFCYPCFACKLYRRVNETCCLFFVPFSLMSTRTKIRTAYRIKGNLCDDCCASLLCPMCSAIQMDSELDNHSIP